MRKTPGILVFEKKKNFNLRKEGEGKYFFLKNNQKNVLEARSFV